MSITISINLLMMRLSIAIALFFISKMGGHKKKTMFVKNELYIQSELDYLKKQTSWDNRWSRAVIESAVGNPIPYVSYPKSSGNLIHHAYHLAQYEEQTGINVNEIDFVFEFGGGYGSMPRLFHNLGFSGHYVIFDLPHFSAIQEYYLKASSLEITSPSSTAVSRKGVTCISNIEDLRKTISSSKSKEKSKSLFLATWSLSEVPVELRDSIADLIVDFSDFLIAYQNQFCEIDNIHYFKKFKESLREISWNNWEIEHLPGNHYLFGIRDRQLVGMHRQEQGHGSPQSKAR